MATPSTRYADYPTLCVVAREAYKLAMRRYCQPCQFREYGVTSGQIDAALRLDLEQALDELWNIISRMEPAYDGRIITRRPWATLTEDYPGEQA